MLPQAQLAQGIMMFKPKSWKKARRYVIKRTPIIDKDDQQLYLDDGMRRYAQGRGNQENLRSVMIAALAWNLKTWMLNLLQRGWRGDALPTLGGISGYPQHHPAQAGADQEGIPFTTRGSVCPGRSSQWPFPREYGARIATNALAPRPFGSMPFHSLHSGTLSRHKK